MIEILIWGICVVIVALGYIAKLVFALTVPVDDRTKNTGIGIFIFYLILAAALFVLSAIQGQEIQRLFGQ